MNSWRSRRRRKRDNDNHNAKIFACLFLCYQSLAHSKRLFNHTILFTCSSIYQQTKDILKHNYAFL